MKINNWKYSFFILWAGQAVSVLTSAILQMALIWNLTENTQSALVLSIASIAGFLPNALFGILAGTLVDRMNRKVAIISADLFIASVSLILVIMANTIGLETWQILAVLAVRSLGTAFHTPAISAVTPLLVPTKELTKCSGYTQSLQTIGYMAGTAIAGVLYPILDISVLVGFDVIGAIFATVAVLLIKIPKLEKTENQLKKDNFWLEIKEGYLVLKNQKGVHALLWIAVFFMILYSPINALFPLMSLDHFNGTTTSASIAEIGFSIGMLGGGVILAQWGGFNNRGFGVAMSIAMMGLPICLSGVLPENGFVFFVLFCILMGVSVPFYNGPVMALIQERIAPEYLGRVFGVYGSMTSFAMPVGLIFSGLFADKTGVSLWFFISGGLCVILAIATYLVPSVRSIEKEKNM